MPTTQITSPQTPEQVIRSMTLCPGGPVGAVMRKEGRLLALVMSVAFIGILVLAIGWYAGAVAGIVFAALLGGAEAVWRRKGDAAVASDAEWLAGKLQRPVGSL